jgi:hypothetical protein
MIINQKNNVGALKNVFYKIFCNNDPFEQMFISSISHKIILYPTNGYHLSEKQFLALVRTIQRIGEHSFYLSEVEGQAFIENGANSIHPDKHLELNIDTTYNEYKNETFIFENALYSRNGKWGVIISHEDHAVLGGCEKFISIFKRLYPDWKKDQEKFKEAFEYWGKLSKKDLSWVSNFLRYING